jgi:hypothetical protein
MALDDDSDPLVNTQGLCEILSSRKILQSRSDHLDLAARMSDEYRRQSARSGRYCVDSISADTVDQKY